MNSTFETTTNITENNYQSTEDEISTLTTTTTHPFHIHR